MDQCEKYKKLLLIVAVIWNLGLLGYFNFLIDIVNHCIGSEIAYVAYQEIRLPIGISFFTFQILSYVIDLYRGQYKAQKNLINLALYISFFPQLIAGPIVKYKDIDVQLAHREITTNKLADGIRRFIYGLGKKGSDCQCGCKVCGYDFCIGLCGSDWMACVGCSDSVYVTDLL